MGDVKLAVLLAHGLRNKEAAQLLEHHNGNLRAAIAALGADRHG
jgi:N-acetylmuramic acid 6-phosphate (MurNAc-6-P) etherase